MGEAPCSCKHIDYHGINAVTLRGLGQPKNDKARARTRSAVYSDDCCTYEIVANIVFSAAYVNTVDGGFLEQESDPATHSTVPIGEDGGQVDPTTFVDAWGSPGPQILI
jgi:hypothetical protein